MKIAIGADHAGFSIKNELISWLENLGHEVVDCGAHELDPLDDFPDITPAVTDRVVSGEVDRGVLVCGTGIGMSIMANRTPKIRAAVLYSNFVAEQSRTNNDANVACFGTRDHTIDDIESALQIWLETEFLGGKYQRRNEKIDTQACGLAD